ncbi:phosphogluconate dehydratase [Alkalilimnicola ehrlichii]|uniref:Phosphogluconate dehydratase n=1 Tax=Alkalilimnicola ehrlichii TaxID=351052 RepID=A0A3E0WKC6_9GAMM|nr:phosphogluconate dehydratase [Alkalilimnicola ehrlichii]RFA32416.1 phosphogluconate dehydratase [Alkalilimnicola ehrlichii]
MAQLNQVLQNVTERIVQRSTHTRTRYLRDIEEAAAREPVRKALACANLAHGFAAAPQPDKDELKSLRWPNIAIVSAYNDMLSAHQPLGDYPAIIKAAAREAGATAQFAGGVPAMCDGVTQGRAGMELSLFSRDVIAMSTAIALSHDMFDAALCLGVCDKIVPGLLIGALRFGHLPVVFVPAGPMPSGLPNRMKARVRQLFAEGKAGRDELLQAESESYHGPGTCTFYGTANSNQLLMELMGLHLPGSAFVNPGTPLRDALTAEAARRVAGLTSLGGSYTPIGHVIDERAIVNGIVGLLASGGSTNHTIHLVAVARAAGILINWDDFEDLAGVVPLLMRVYPNGSADVNHFHAAGGMAFLTRELLDAGLLHEDVVTVAGQGLRAYTQEPWLDEGRLRWRQAPDRTGDAEVLRPLADPFDRESGLRVMVGNLGRAVIKTSAVKPEHRVVEAPAKVFYSQQALLEAFQAGELEQDFVAVLPCQGPRACGMPELHKLTPALGVLQDRGFKVALVTDGRMSGASGKVPAAIHVTPEAVVGGELARVRDGDLIRLDSIEGRLEALVEAREWTQRRHVLPQDPDGGAMRGTGRELFDTFRNNTSGAEEGAMSILTGLDNRAEPDADLAIEREATREKDTQL